MRLMGLCGVCSLSVKVDRKAQNSMNIFEYDALHFSRDYNLVCDGNPAVTGFPENLNRIADADRRAQFCVSLCWRVLASQAVHAHFREVHEAFGYITHYPKMLASLAAGWPDYILTEPINVGLVTRELLEIQLNPGMHLFAETCRRILRSNFPAIGFDRFSHKLLQDDDRIKQWSRAPADDIRHILYLTLRNALRAVADGTHYEEVLPPAPIDWIAPEDCLAVVTQDGLALERVKDQTPEICEAAVKQNPTAIQFARPDNVAVARWMTLWRLGH